MRILGVIFVLGGLSSGVAAQTATPDGVARTFSKLAFIAGDCSKIMRVDKELVEQYLGAAALTGQQMVGQKVFKVITMKEMRRRDKEVRATGLSAWCSYQKSDVDALGLKAFVEY